MEIIRKTGSYQGAVFRRAAHRNLTNHSDLSDEDSITEEDMVAQSHEGYVGPSRSALQAQRRGGAVSRRRDQGEDYVDKLIVQYPR
jgi:DNA gyrase/topoisomerase IV subunit A